jgi:hypothetical protein
MVSASSLNRLRVAVGNFATYLRTWSRDCVASRVVDAVGILRWLRDLSLSVRPEGRRTAISEIDKIQNW